ncbi:MAG TPA: hypothetical protein VLM85_18025 [Polyangiaceae bacterium]|nr:hypothetical protein [Polyangiaceae bacterium]
MRPTIIALVLLGGCAASRSSFDFELGTEKVASSGAVSGSVDNAGTLALHDDAWALDMSLPGLGFRGWVPLGGGGTDLTIISKTSGEIYTTAAGGTCQVQLDPHQSTNGSVVSGTFMCSGLSSSDGTKQVDVPSGAFQTQIEDSANNPTPSWPWP